MIRRLLGIGLTALALHGGAAVAEPPAPPVPTPSSPSGSIRCYGHDYRPNCGYWATGTGRLWAARVGAWSARIYRNHQLVWQVGGASAYTMTIPSQPGDRVEIVLIEAHGCELPVADYEAPFCGGVGAVVATEGVEVPYLP